MNGMTGGWMRVGFMALCVAFFSGCEPGGGGGGSLGDGHDFGSNDPNLYAAIGDSITAGDSFGSYPAILSGLIGKPVANEGVPGSTAGDGAARVGGILNSLKPGYLLILYGANDVIHGHDDAATIANLQRIIQSAKNNQTIPVIATLTPMDYSHVIFNGGVQSLNNAIRNLASQEGITLVDLESAFGSTPIYLQSDGLHPNDSGYALIAQEFAGAL